MNGKLKLFISAILVVFITGCNLEYKIDINKDLSLTEYITVEEDNNVILEKELNIDTIINEKKNQYSFTLGNYTTNINKDDDITSVDNFKQYNKLSDFIKEESSVIGRVLKNRKYSVVRKIGTLTGTLVYPSAYEEDDKFDDVYFTVRLPFVVTDHNADSVSGGTLVKEYKWKIEKYETDKEIKISFNTDKILQPKKNEFELNIGYIIIIIILFVFAILSFIFVKRFKESNKM